MIILKKDNTVDPTPRSWRFLLFFLVVFRRDLSSRLLWGQLERIGGCFGRPRDVIGLAGDGGERGTLRDSLFREQPHEGKEERSDLEKGTEGRKSSLP